ncbi:synapse-associated protein, putative [Ricinus communis]|uniref:Synapse-associated protein, putative n=1 Tax=Ricinus communis TaxID=3988 RepID=B9RSU4_RICCO|nr:synapse-associated protein, putative [Ricinus communis]
MNFFKSVFSDEPTPPDSPKSRPDSPTSQSPNTGPTTSAWSFGDLIKTLSTKSESMIQTYRQDFEELGSGLRKETAVIRDVASRAVKVLPASFEIGASVAQESLETVGQAIDDIGATVWKSTAQIISHGKDSILASDNYNSNDRNQESLNLKRYSRFDMQLNAIQCDLNTYCNEPEDKVEYENWILGFFDLEEKKLEIDSLLGENRVVEEFYNELVPSRVDSGSFWSRYFYKVHKLKKAEEARALLVKRAISGEEDLRWDFEDEDDDNNNNNICESSESQNKNSKKNVKDNLGDANKLEKCEEKADNGEEDLRWDFEDEDDDNNNNNICESSESQNKNSKKNVKDNLGDANKLEKCEEKADNGESCKDSDVSVISSPQSLLLEEEDLGWDEIEEIDERKGVVMRSATSTSRIDLHKRLSAAEEEEDLSWDIDEDDNEGGKPGYKIGNYLGGHTLS